MYYEELERKIKLNKKLLEKYSLDELKQLEKDIYGDMSVPNIINYEFNRLIDDCKLINNKNDYKILCKLIDQLKLALENKPIDYKKIKKILNICQIISSNNFSFYEELLNTEAEDIEELMKRGK